MLRSTASAALLVQLWVKIARVNVQSLSRLPLTRCILFRQTNNFQLTVDWPSISMTCVYWKVIAFIICKIMIQSIPEVAKKAFVSKCLNMTLSSLSQKSPSQTTLQWSPVSPTPTDQRISQKVNCKHTKCKLNITIFSKSRNLLACREWGGEKVRMEQFFCGRMLKPDSWSTINWLSV